MPTCQDMTELATSYLEGALSPSEREDFERHLQGCEGCTTWLAQLKTTIRLAGSLPAPELPAACRDALLARFDAWKAGQEVAAPAPVAPVRSRAWAGRAAAVGLVVALPAVLVALARHPVRVELDLAAGAGLAAVAVLLAALAGRLTLGWAATAAAAAVAAALLRGEAGDHDLRQGIDCLGTVLASAGGLAGLGVLAARGGLTARAGTWAVAGALAADAALQVSCQAHAARAHLLLFHAGAVVVVALVALAWSARHPEPA